MIVFNDMNQSIILNINNKMAGLHSHHWVQGDVLPVHEDGQYDGKLYLELTDQEADSMLCDWFRNGPFEYGTEETVDRFPESVILRMNQYQIPMRQVS